MGACTIYRTQTLFLMATHGSVLLAYQLSMCSHQLTHVIIVLHVSIALTNSILIPKCVTTYLTQSYLKFNY